MPSTGSSGRPRLLSGMQPTSDSLHLGNYLGALAQWVKLQDDFEALYFVADLHAITMNAPEPEVLRRRTRVTAANYLAAGVDPLKSIVFVQSHVPQHSQLSWVLECLTGHGEAGRMTQFKDKVARGGIDQASVGLFTYPVLQAADILLYSPAAVPVGEDQRQHLELSRDLARRFNHRYGELLRVPEPHITKSVGKILDLQHPDKKMSSSVGGAGCVFLADDPKVSAKKIRSAVTDTGREVVFDPEHKPGVSNLLTILAALTDVEIPQLEEQFKGAGYGDLKKAVAEAYLAFAEPFVARSNDLMAHPDDLDDVLFEGARQARELAAPLLEQVYAKVGFLPGKG
jgi:tryptophanyl-tRNA synthetase